MTNTCGVSETRVCIELLSSCLHSFPNVALSYYAAATISRTFLLLQSYLVWSVFVEELRSSVLHSNFFLYSESVPRLKVFCINR